MSPTFIITVVVFVALAITIGLSFVLRSHSRAVLRVGFLVIGGFLTLGLLTSIGGEIKLQKEIQASEAKVIEGLKRVRIAQEAYLKQYGEYADSWDELERFVAEDILYTIEKIETSTALGKDDPRFYELHGELVEISYDTIGQSIASDKLFPHDKFPNFRVSSLRKIPNADADQDYFLQTKVDSSSVLKGVKVNFVEVVDKFPLDPKRTDDSDNPKRRFLRFGSLDSPNTGGNWE